jgi:hypothetical protein
MRADVHESFKLVQHNIEYRHLHGMSRVNFRAPARAVGGRAPCILREYNGLEKSGANRLRRRRAGGPAGGFGRG